MLHECIQTLSKAARKETIFRSCCLIIHLVRYHAVRAWSKKASQTKCSIFTWDQLLFTKKIAFLSIQHNQITEPQMSDQIGVTFSNLQGNFDPSKHCCHVSPGHSLLTLGICKRLYITKIANSQIAFVFEQV
jgi:hypothetical protein